MNSSLIINASVTALVNVTNFTLDSIQNVSISNKDNERDISELVPFILMGAFIVCVFIAVCILCYKDSKHQTMYLEAVRSRKYGDVVEWQVD